MLLMDHVAYAFCAVSKVLILESLHPTDKETVTFSNSYILKQKVKVPPKAVRYQGSQFFNILIATHPNRSILLFHYSPLIPHFHSLSPLSSTIRPFNSLPISQYLPVERLCLDEKYQKLYNILGHRRIFKNKNKVKYLSGGNPWCNTLWFDKGDRTWGWGSAS